MSRKIFKKFGRQAGYNLFFVGCLVLLAFVAVSFSREFMKAREINTEIVTLQDEIAKLEERNTELSGLIQYFDSESYAERQARVELGLKKPDEEVIVIPTQPTLEVPPGQADADEALSNPVRWWRYFFGHK